jgi:SAM-dependent methyltransferase
MPTFACPECRAEIVPVDRDGLACAGCHARFEQRDGIFRFLTHVREGAARPFERQYRHVRAREGRNATAQAGSAALAPLPPGHTGADEWRVRRESCTHLERHALANGPATSARILDLGAGNGWLSRRLASAGHRVVAVDRLDDAAEGLGACRGPAENVVAVQADFDALPFEPRQFDLVVFNASLHYAPDPAATLASGTRMLAHGGTLAVMDSPAFESAAHGEAMVADQMRRMQAEHGVASPVRTGAGYLTFGAMSRAFASNGLTARFLPSRGPLVWRVRRHLARFRLRRQPAAFGVWVAR